MFFFKTKLKIFILLYALFCFFPALSLAQELDCQDLAQQVLSAPFLKDKRYKKYARPFLRTLTKAPRTAYVKDINWPWRSKDDLNAAVKHPNLKLQAYEAKDEEEAHIVLLGVFFAKKNDKHPIGYFAVMFKHNKKGELEALRNGVYFDLTSAKPHGIAALIVKFLDDSIYRPLKVKREIIKADYIGRYVWAKLGYQFTQDNRYWFKDVDNDKPYKTIEMMRKNFERFLKLHDMDVSELNIRSIEDFHSPIDFMNAIHSKSKRVRIQPLIAEETLGEETEMDVGKAFMLSDYRTIKNPKKKTFITSKAGTKFSPAAMPYWNGYREFFPE